MNQKFLTRIDKKYKRLLCSLVDGVTENLWYSPELLIKLWDPVRSQSIASLYWENIGETVHEARGHKRGRKRFNGGVTIRVMKLKALFSDLGFYTTCLLGCLGRLERDVVWKIQWTNFDVDFFYRQEIYNS